MVLNEDFQVAVPTAFYEDETLNLKATLQHIDYLATQGVQSVLVGGSTGEQHSLTLLEKLQLLDALKKLNTRNDLEIIFGVSSIRQKEAEILAQKINTSNEVTGILLGFPPYILPSQQEAISYAKSVISFANKPTILYNKPRRTGFDITIDPYLTLLKDDWVIGIKEAGDPAHLPELLAKIEKPLKVYMGGESAVTEKLALGFNAISSIAGNIYPTEIKQWFTELKNKQPSSDQTIATKIEELYAHSPLPYVKSKISENEGISFGICRRPLGNNE